MPKDRRTRKRSFVSCRTIARVRSFAVVPFTVRAKKTRGEFYVTPENRFLHHDDWSHSRHWARFPAIAAIAMHRGRLVISCTVNLSEFVAQVANRSDIDDRRLCKVSSNGRDVGLCVCVCAPARKCFPRWHTRSPPPSTPSHPVRTENSSRRNI